MKIGALAEATGIPPATIRFYEAEGLLAAPARTAGNYRDYGTAELERLRFVGRCRSLGMELGEIRTLLDWRESAAPDCAGVDALLDDHLSHVRERIRELRQLEAQLKALRARCGATADVAACGILRELSSGDAAPGRPAAGPRSVHR